MSRNWNELLDIADEEEEEENNEGEQAVEPQPEESQKPAQEKSKDADLPSDDDEIDKSNMSDKQKKILELRTSLDQVLNNLELKNFKKAHEEYTKLQGIYKRPPKVIKNGKNPHFLIRELLEITQKVKELSKSEKDLRKFEQNIKKFNRSFEKELQECEENPDNFPLDDEYLDDENDDNDDEDDDDDAGGWFIDESPKQKAEENTKQKAEEKDQKKSEKSTTRRDRSKAVEERLSEDKKAIDDETAKKELEEISSSRKKGKIIRTVAQLDEILQAVKSKDLSHQFQLEICYTVEEDPSNQAIPLESWNLILEFLPEMLDDAKTLVPLFERLNRDFWARSVHPKYLFTPDVARLHEILPTFKKLMNDYSVKLREQKEYALCTRLENMLLEHIYQDETVDVMPHVLSILELLSRNIFDPTITNSYRCKAALLLATNLAIRKFPLSAADVFSRIPVIPSIPDNAQLQILSNRTSAQIGISAFNEGYYKLSYMCLKKFQTSKYIEKNLGQDPPIYPPWLIIEKKTIVRMLHLSALFLDLPYLTVPIKDESKLLIWNELHKSLTKEGIPSTPNLDLTKISPIINFAKIGDWKKSSSLALAELGDRFQSSEKFITDLKKISLCSFLLTANNYYESIKFDNLVKKFELSKDVVLEETKNMIDGFGPFEKAQIEFNGKITDDQNFIVFNNKDVESPFARFGAVIQVKTQTMKDSLQNLK